MRRTARAFVIAVALLAASFVAAPGHAANVDVTLRVATGHYYNPTAICRLSVPENSDGIVVLDAAKVTGCIQSYVAVLYPPYGYFIDCIDGTCTESSPPYRYWSMRENVNAAGVRSPVCPPTDYGVSGFRANHGDELSFTYETAATGVLPVVCLPS